MKSKMVENAYYIKDKENYSELQVLQSGAGYYIGTMYRNNEPGSRDSGYYKTKEEAEKALKEETWDQRMYP